LLWLQAPHARLYTRHTYRIAVAASLFNVYVCASALCALAMSGLPTKPLLCCGACSTITVAELREALANEDMLEPGEVEQIIAEVDTDGVRALLEKPPQPPGCDCLLLLPLDSALPCLTLP